MSEEMGGHIEDLLLGEAQESAKMSPAEAAARQAAANKAIAKLRKQEKTAKGHDHVLVEIIKTLPFDAVREIAWFISAEISSLLILAMMSPQNEGAKRYIQSLFNPYVQEWADFSSLEAEMVYKKVISQTWTYIVMANHITDTGKIAETPHKKEIIWSKLQTFTNFRQYESQKAYQDKAEAYFNSFFPSEEPPEGSAEAL